MDHPFRGQGALLFLLAPFFCGVFLGLAAGRAWHAAAALLLLLSVPLLVFRFPPLAAASTLMALCGVLCAGRVPLADPAAVRPLLDAEVVLRAEVEEARPADGGFSGLAGNAAVSGLDGS